MELKTWARRLRIILCFSISVCIAQEVTPSPGGGGGGGSSGQYSTPSVGYTIGTYYFPTGGGLAANATRTNVATVQGSGGTISKFAVTIPSGTGSGSAVFTWFDGATGESVTCTAAASSNGCSDATDTFNYSAGDALSIQMIVSTATITSSIAMTWGTGQIGPTGATGIPGATGAPGSPGPTGPVSSVGLTLPTWFSVANSPITSSGTIVATPATGQTSHQVIGTCGAATTFTPCALVAGDIPQIPVSTGISGLGTGIATWLATPSSVNLLAAMTTSTGTGNLVFATSPTFVTPALGTPASGNASNLTNLPIALTTTGTSGASVYTQSTNTLNIPQYSGGGGGSTGQCAVGGTTSLTITVTASTNSCPLTLSASATSVTIVGGGSAGDSISFAITEGATVYTMASPSNFTPWPGPLQQATQVTNYTCVDLDGTNWSCGAPTSTATNGQCLEVSAPGTPAATFINDWCDSTNARPQSINPAGVIFGQVKDIAAVTNDVVNSIVAGIPTLVQLGFSNLSGSAACSQLPALTGDTTTSAGSCATTTARINGTSFTGTNGHLVGFGAANIPVDSNVVSANVIVEATPSAGIFRSAGGTQTATTSELSGDVTTTGSNITTVVQVEGATIPTSATVVATNSSKQLIAATYQGNGAKVQLSTGTTTTGDCVKFDANGNTVDNGSACGSGGGSQIYSYGGAFVNGGSNIVSPTFSLPGQARGTCTILSWNISINATDSGTATVKFLKVATGTASPGSANSINTSGVSLATGTHVASTTLTDFTTTAVTAGDVIAVELTAVSGTVTGLSAAFVCQ